ncbi:MAG: LysM peptidoglycan-binding domain-containing protein [Arenicella sp.]
MTRVNQFKDQALNSLFKKYVFFAVLCLILLNAFALNNANAQTQPTSIDGVRIWHAPDHSRIVFDVSKKANYSIKLLDNPNRYVVDFKNTTNQSNIPVNQTNQRINQLRAGPIDSQDFRVVIPIQKALSVKSFQLSPNDVYGHRLVLDLFEVKQTNNTKQSASNSINKQANSQRTLNKEDTNNVHSPTPKTPAPTNTLNYAQPLKTKKHVIVAIDAGHGGEDPGALGSRSKEKHVTLAISKRLAKLINQTPGMKAVLIRDRDYFVRLRSRTIKARKANADIFVSIHADAALNKSARGMSVFALSQRGASSALARALAQKENQADLVGGVSIKDKDDELAQVLLDLSLTNKISESVELGSFVLKRLSRLGKLHSKRVEQAGFAVLKSPDIPSILVETGFITNRAEEKRLLTRQFQQQLAQQIYTGIVDYINKNPIQVANASFQITPSNHSISYSNTSESNGTNETKFHTVRSGDSLSKIASQYGIRLKQLKQWNNLKSNVAYKGQRLRVSPKQSSSSKNSSPTHSIISYKVKRGDTLSGIADKYSDSMSAIRKRNKLKSSNVYVGQRLKVKRVSNTQRSSTVKTRTTKPRIHTVKSGEYLSSISAKYNISIKQLKSLNKLKSSNIYVGQKLRVSNQQSSSKNAIKTIKHRVTRGQTLSGLSQKYGVKQSDIVAWNKLKKRELFIGQRLIIKTKK